MGWIGGSIGRQCKEKYKTSLGHSNEKGCHHMTPTLLVMWCIQLYIEAEMLHTAL